MPDIRIEYLETISSMILKFKADKWGKLERRRMCPCSQNSLTKQTVSVLVLTLNPAGMIIPCLGFPESLKSKGAYFIKTKPESITKDNYKTHLLYGDINPTPVDQLIAVVEE
ncbi:dynein heavy chain 17, axonemal isoform X1, partial [Sigmodon hispidus]